MQTTDCVKTAHICGQCNECFGSRNKLFKHIKSCNNCEDITHLKARKDAVSVHEFSTGLSANFDHSSYAIYVTGGRVRGRTLGSVERFVFTTNSWELCTPLLENRGSHGATAIDGKLYVVGGGGFESNLGSCEALDITTSTWSYVAATSILRHALVLVPFSHLHPSTPPSSSQSSCFYAIGGWIDGKLCSADVERYDVSSNTWSRCSSMKVARRLLGGTAYRDRIYIFGGNCDDGMWYTAAVEEYEPATDVWTRRSDLPYPGPTSAVTVGENIYVFCHGKRVYKYSPQDDSYSALSALPLPEWYTFDVTSLGPFVFLHGGATKGEWSRAMFMYNTCSDSWTHMPDMIRQRRRCAAAIIKIA